MTTTAEHARFDIPAETDLDRAPGLLDGAMSLDLTPQTCNLEYWLRAVAQGTLRGRVKGGHRRDTSVPDWMREPGPLHQALVEEFALRSIAEEGGATRPPAQVFRRLIVNRNWPALGTAAGSGRCARR